MVLTEDEREDFSLALLGDVLASFKRAGLISKTFVVTSNHHASSLAATFGARTIDEGSDRGVSEAVRLGTGTLGPGDFLVVPSDLPMLSRSDILAVIEAKQTGFDVVLAPSAAFDGTNAYLFSSSDNVLLSYDDDSFWNHVAGAAKGGLRLSVCTRKGFVFDVDNRDDLACLGKSGKAGRSAAMARRALD